MSGQPPQLPARPGVPSTSSVGGIPSLLPAAPRAVRPTLNPSADTGVGATAARPTMLQNIALPASSGHRDPSTSTPTPRTTFYPAAAQHSSMPGGGYVDVSGPRLVAPAGVPEPQFSTHSPVRRTSAAPTPTVAAVDSTHRVSAAAHHQPPQHVADHTTTTIGSSRMSGSVPHSRTSSVISVPATAARPEAAAVDLQAIPEDELLRELVYVMLGSEQTQYSTWSTSAQCYSLVKGTVRQRNVFDHLQECGVLRRKIRRLLNVQSPSFLQQSLKKAVERQLEQHDLFIASLRERVPMRIGDLEIAHRKSLPKLQALFVILRDTESAKGGELVTRLQTLHQHGGREMSAFLSDVYREAVRPLLHMTVHWITKGEIVDPYLEFFICENTTIRDSDDAYWSSKYNLRGDMLPATLSPQQAKEVLLIGKNIDFIHRCCKAKDWKMAPSIVTAARAATFDVPQSVADVIRDALTHTNEAVLHLLFEKNNLREVLAASRSLFLVATGDLFDLIVDRLEPVLAAPGIRIDPTVVEDNLKQAAHPIMPYLSAPERDALDHVQVVLDTTNKMLSGFECFTISLPFMKPHNAVLHREAVHEYQMLFRFLYKVKRADVLLKRAWRQAVYVDRLQVRATQTRTRAARHRSIALYKHFNGFVGNVQMYLVTEVIQSAWVSLQASLAQCKTLDEVIHSHDDYLITLSKRALLDPQYARASGDINTMLDLSFKYCDLQGQLETAAFAGNDAMCGAIVDKFVELFDQFHVSMSRLLTLLEEDTVRYDFLQPLGSRLNFNNFYHVEVDQVRNDF